MENQISKEEILRAEKQDSVSLENEENALKKSNKAVTSIKDVIEKHPPSKATHDLPLDEQQYDHHQKNTSHD